METVVVLDGRRSDEEAMDAISGVLTERLQQRSARYEVLRLCDLDIGPCMGCFGCWTRTPGECVIEDAAHAVTRKVVGSNVTVFLTPIVFGGYSSELKKAVDRLIPIVSPLFRRVRGEVHHKPRYARYPNLLGIGVIDDATSSDAEAFRQLVARNAVNLMSPSYATAVLGVVDEREQWERAVGEALAGVGVS